MQLASVHDLDRTLGSHHRKFGGRPRKGEVSSDRLRVHHDVRTAVGLAGDDLNPWHRRLTEGVQQLRSVTDDAFVFLVDAGKEPGNVDEYQQRNVERIAGANEAGGFLRGLDVEYAGEHHRLIRHDADGATINSTEATDHRLGPMGEVLHELAIVDHGGDHLMHVIGHRGAVGKDRVEFGAEPLRVIGRLDRRRVLEVVLRQQ